jgi:hypothetical protein
VDGACFSVHVSILVAYQKKAEGIDPIRFIVLSVILRLLLCLKFSRRHSYGVGTHIVLTVILSLLLCLKFSRRRSYGVDTPLTKNLFQVIARKVLRDVGIASTKVFSRKP